MIGDSLFLVPGISVDRQLKSAVRLRVIVDYEETKNSFEKRGFLIKHIEKY